MKLLLTISYLGANYAGWQVQPNAPTVQAQMCRAADELFGCKCAITGCSRTDSGVHAREFLCTVEFDGEHNAVPCDRVPQAMNSLLPQDIAVIACGPCADDFHPRYGIRGKEYVYTLLNSRIRDPFLDGRAYLFPAPLDADKMNVCAREFVGEHDFSAFMAAGSKIEDARREVFDCSVERDGDVIRFTVSANGFLYNMVRIMVGTLIDCGLGKRNADDIRRALQTGLRSDAGTTVPACGLCLNRVLK